MNDEQIPDWAKTWYYDKGFAEAEEFWRFEERQRIIKLLEKQCDWLIQNNWAASHIKAANFKEAIALINGENK